MATLEEQKEGRSVISPELHIKRTYSRAERKKPALGASAGSRKHTIRSQTMLEAEKGNSQGLVKARGKDRYWITVRATVEDTEPDPRLGTPPCMKLCLRAEKGDNHVHGQEVG